MPYRTVGVAWILAGTCAVVLLLILGRDVWSAAATGPRWKRRLLTAGLLLLAGIGLCPQATAGPARHVAPARRLRLSASPQWRVVVRTWRHLEAIAAGRLTPPASQYHSEVQRLNQQAASARRALAELQTKGLIGPDEARPVRMELDDLLSKALRALPEPKNLARPTCYMMPNPVFLAKRQVQRRLEVLERIAKSGRVHPEVVQLVRRQVEPWTHNKLASQDPQGARLTARLRRVWQRILSRVGGKRR